MEPSAGRLPTGLKLACEVLTPAEEAGLIALIEAEQLSPYAMDAGNPRSSLSFGWKYDFRNDDFVPCRAMPAGLRSLCEIAARFAGVGPDNFAECLVNRYEPGAIIQPHRDKPVWDLVIGISLGAATVMRFQDPDQPDSEAFQVPLPARSIYLMAGPARYIYHHSLPHIEATRWSITLRSFRPKDGSCVIVMLLPLEI